MRKLICLVLVCVAVSGTVRAADRKSSPGDKVLAGAALLVDAHTGEVVFSRRPDTPYPPASTVKLLTALLVWEKTRLEGTIEVTREDTMVEPSHVPLRVGEVVSVREMTRALLVGSDNDTAMALGRKVAGDHKAFISLMNRRARELGCTQSLFHNPNGLPSKGQVTTARDLMRIFRAVLAVPELRQICSTPSFTLRTAVGAQRVKNHNKLLGVYQGMGPAKTGWTVASRHTYAASAMRDGRELWLVLLNSPNKWNDARVLFDYGFSRPTPKPRETDPPVTVVANPPVHPIAPTAVLRSPLEAEAAAQVPAGSRVVPSTPASAPAPIATAGGVPASAGAGSGSPASVRHTVRKGDTLYSIARTYGVAVDRLVVANGISDPRRLQPGMDLRIP